MLSIGKFNLKKITCFFRALLACSGRIFDEILRNVVRTPHLGAMCRKGGAASWNDENKLTPTVSALVLIGPQGNCSSSSASDWWVVLSCVRVLGKRS